MDFGFRAHQPLAAIPARSASGPYQAAARHSIVPILPKMDVRFLEFTHFLSVEMRRTRMDKG